MLWQTLLLYSLILRKYSSDVSTTQKLYYCLCISVVPLIPARALLEAVIGQADIVIN